MAGFALCISVSRNRTQVPASLLLRRGLPARRSRTRRSPLRRGQSHPPNGLQYRLHAVGERYRRQHEHDTQRIPHPIHRQRRTLECAAPGGRWLCPCQYLLCLRDLSVMFMDFAFLSRGGNISMLSSVGNSYRQTESYLYPALSLISARTSVKRRDVNPHCPAFP